MTSERDNHVKELSFQHELSNEKCEKSKFLASITFGKMNFVITSSSWNENDVTLLTFYNTFT